MKLSEIPFDPEIGLEGLELIRQKKSLEKTTGISFAVSRPTKTKAGHSIQVYYNQPCHGLLRGSGMFEMCATAFTPGEMDGLYDFFVNGTDFGRFVLNRDKYKEDHFLAITGDLWYPFQNCLNIFARQSREGYGTWMQKQFDEFIARGVPPLVALLVVSSTNMFKDHSGDIVNVGYRSAHSLTSTLSVDGLKNFFAGNAIGYQTSTPNKPTIKPNSYDGGIWAWEENGKPCYIHERWLSVCWEANSEAVLKKRGLKKSYSPFTQNTNNAYPAFRRNQFYDHVLPFLLDVYYSVHGQDRIATPTRPAGEIVCEKVDGILDTIQEYGDAFTRAVGVRN